MLKLVSFENTFFEYFGNDPNADAFGCCTIDGHPADENESGEVVARVWITKHGDIIVDWHENGYRLNNTVLNLIEESKTALQTAYKEVMFT